MARSTGCFSKSAPQVQGLTRFRLCGSITAWAGLVHDYWEGGRGCSIILIKACFIAGLRPFCTFA
eukprot:351139-Chlamydomonas_euryale.AAC.2